MGIALVNIAMLHNNTATHKGARPSALNTTHVADKRTIASERNSSTMRAVVKEQRITGAFLTDGPGGGAVVLGRPETAVYSRPREAIPICEGAVDGFETT